MAVKGETNLTLAQGCATFLWQGATPVIVGWFTSPTWKASVSDTPSRLNYCIILWYIDNVRGTLLVEQLVEALRYKSEGREFDSRWCHWIFSLT